MTRLATGIEGFDAMVQGGLPAGSSVVIQGPPGQEKIQFALTFLAEGLKSGGSGLVVVSTQSPDAVLAELRGLGVDLDAVTAENRLRIVDWYSWSEETVADIEDRGIVIRSSIDLTNLGVALSRAIAALSGDQGRRAVIDMLSSATNAYEITQVYAFAQSAKKKFDRHGFTSLVLLEKDMHSGSDMSTLLQPFDGVIEVERTRSGDRILRKIGVLHMKDTAADSTFRLLEVTESGMRVVKETTKPSAGAPPVGGAAGSVLESQEERARRLSLIMQIASERLKLNPNDADALFAMAAAQATLDDPRGGLQSLDRLADLDPSYPGLWVLKTKLHARLGEPDRARQSRLKGQQIELPETAPAKPTVPCPMCDAPVTDDATVCGNCGVKFALTRKLEDELEDLGHAAIQDMVQEELDEGATPKPVKPKPTDREPQFIPTPEPAVVPPAKPLPKPTPKKGLTNGLVMSRSARRRAGMTNGLKGRTNGLRGRTNGLTNGLGRTNGLTNGMGRTNGLTNGLGRTNGLTNGLGRTNGLTNGLGHTNGLTNGLGRTNGLTNGLAGARATGFRSTGFRGMMRTAGWKLYVIPLVVVGLLLMPLFFVPEYHGPSYPIQIDGQFNDWAAVTTEAMASGSVLNPNIDVVRFGVMPNLGPFAFYVEVAGSALVGGGAPPGTMDTVRIFVDIDGLSSTGYRIDGLGADRMIDLSGHNGTVLSSTLWEFDSNRDQRDWNGWIKGTATPAATSGSRIEAQAEWLAGVSPSIPVVATVHTTSWDGQTDSGDFPVSPGLGTLSIVSDPQVPDVLAGSSVSLLRLTLTAHGQPVTLNSIQIEIAGTSSPNAATSLGLTDGVTMLSQVTPTSRNVLFSFPTIQVAVDGSTTLFVVGDFASATGETFGVRFPSSHPFGVSAGVVALRQNSGARTLGYLGSVPSTPRVDGAFDEWTALSSDAMNDVGPRPNSDIDLGRYGAQRNGTSTFLYTDVTGRILTGTSAPELPRQVPSQSQGPADTDRDGVPDAVDPFPSDFNNDGVPDAQSNGDYDGDGIVDYGFSGGTDSWLNTTIPSSFPAPYAGRPASLYIGPDNRPQALGEDVIRLFLDLDSSSSSGYSIGGIGADRLVEIRGKDDGLTQSALLAFSGSFPGQWAWTPLSPVTVALGYHALELSVPLNASNLYVETGDFWGSVDSTTVVRAFAAQTSSFKVSAAGAPLSVPWEQVGPQPYGTLIDPGSNAATTVYNQQRKVVRAGDTPGGSCDQTNSDGCWYTVLYDQFLEATANTPPSTETIATGSGCGGTFPASIQSADNVYRCLREGLTSPEEIGAIGFKSNTGNGVNFPKQWDWTGSAWGTPETELATAGAAVENVRTVWDTASGSTLFWIVENAAATITVYKCTNVDTCSSETTATTQGVGAAPERHWDVSVEASSGELLLVYDCNVADATKDFCYRTRTAGSSGSWSAEQYLDHSSIVSTNPSIGYITLANNPGSNRIGMGAFDTTNDDFVVAVWDGTAWVNANKVLATAVTLANGWGGTVLAEDASDEFVAYASLGTNNMVECEWTSAGGWEAGCFTFDPNPSSNNDLRTMFARPLLGTDKGMVCQSDDLDDVTCWRWNGAVGTGSTHGAITKLTAADGSGGAIDTRIGFDWNPDQSGTADGLAVYYESTIGSLGYNTYDGATDTWGSSPGTFSSAGSHKWVDLMRTKQSGNTDKVFVVTSNSNNDVLAYRWTGSGAPASETSITADTVNENYPYWGLAFQESPASGYALSVRYDWSAVPAGDSHTLQIKGYRSDENLNVQVLTLPATWNTRITISSMTNTMYNYALTSSEYNGGAPSVRLLDSNGLDGSQSDGFIDFANVATNSDWDRVVLMRSRDTSGSTWGPQVILASGRAGDSPLYPYDSAEPSIAIDSLGYLHVVWVSAGSTGNQQTLNRVRYTKSTFAYPTESQIATANWEVVTPVDDTNPGYMPTVSTDTGGYPHIAWSQSKTVASEGAEVAYRSNTGTDGVNSLKTRSWDGSAWGPEVEQTNAGSPVREVRSARSPIDPDTSIVVTQGDDAWIDAYVCTPSCTMTSNVGQAGTAYFHSFEVAFEQSSGDALLVWVGSDGNTTHDIRYMTYAGGAWSAVQWYDDTTSPGPYGLVELAPKKGSDQIGLVGGDVGQQDITALIWDGSAFTNFVEVNTGSNTPGYENAAIAWESNSGHLLVVSADASSTTCRYMVYTTSWQPASTFTCGGTSTIRYLSLKANPVPTANDMVLSVSDLGAELSTVYWTGSAWNARVSQDPGVDEIDVRSFDFAWEATGSKGLLVYATTAAQLASKRFTAPSTWTSLPNVGAGANTHRWVQARTNPNPAGAVKILGDVWENTANDLGAWSWDGSTLTMISTTAFTADTGSIGREAYDLEYRPLIGGYVYYKNQAGGGWKATVSWGPTYTGLSVDVSPQNNYASLARYSEQFPDDSVIAYRSNTGTNTINSLKTRTWDGAAWGVESEQSTSGSPIRAVRMAWSPTAADLRIVVTESDDGWLDAYVCRSTCTVTNNIGQVWSSAPADAQARFDVAFEQVSGRGLLVYHKEGGSGTQDIAYKMYSGGAWGAEQYIDDPGSASTHYVYSVIKLASKKGTNQVGLIGADFTNTHVNAWIWDGSTWANFVAVTTSAGPVNTDNADLAWESNSGHLLAIAATTGTNIVSKEFTTSWGGAVTFACISAGATMQYTRLKANPLATADDMVAAVVDSTYALNTCYWTGSAWANRVTHDGGIDQYLYRDFDFAWESAGSKGLLVYSTTAGQMTYRTFTAPNTWGSVTNVAMGANDHTWVQLRTNPFPGATKILGAASENSVSDLGAFRWDGTTFTLIGSSAITTDTGGFPGNEQFDLKYREPSAGGTGEIQYTVCKDLSTSNCDAVGEFTKWDGSAGFDTIAVGVETGSYPSLATTWDANGDLWVAYAKDVDGTSRAIYAAQLDYPTGGWQAAEAVDWLSGTLFSRPSIGLDKDNVAHILYVASSGPQLYYKSRPGGVWDARTAIDASSDHPSIVVRAPNDLMYGTTWAAVYWKGSTSETQFFYIPEFETIIAPLAGTLFVVLFLARRTRLRAKARGLSEGGGSSESEGRVART